jgi:predicted DsbA family dithiol-disulfide isomerase
MATPLKIEFVSDISCGWCAVGLQAIERALDNIRPDVAATFNFQPFELNPEMPLGGERLGDYLRRKYGEQAGQQYISGTRQQGAEVGLEINLHEESRIYNTFDCHRILHWAEQKGCQAALQHALFGAYFTNNDDPGSHDVLLKCVQSVGLDPLEAQCVLASDAYASDVRDLQEAWLSKGVHAVPTIIINDKYVVQGTRSVEIFEQMFRTAVAAAGNVAPAPFLSAPGGEV